MSIMEKGIGGLPPLDKATETRVLLFGHKQVYFIKFEGGNKALLSTYTEIVKNEFDEEMKCYFKKQSNNTSGTNTIITGNA